MPRVCACAVAAVRARLGLRLSRLTRGEPHAQEANPDQKKEEVRHVDVAPRCVLFPAVVHTHTHTHTNTHTHTHTHTHRCRCARAELFVRGSSIFF